MLIESTSVTLLLENTREEREKKDNNLISTEDKNLPCYGFSVVLLLLNLKSSCFLQ